MRLVSFLLRPRWKYRALSTAGVDKLGRQWSFAELLQLWVWPIVCVLVISLFYGKGLWRKRIWHIAEVTRRTFDLQVER